MIRELAGQQRYQLPAMCERFSAGRANDPSKLSPGEAWMLIEALKKIIDREGDKDGAQQST